MYKKIKIKCILAHSCEDDSLDQKRIFDLSRIYDPASACDVQFTSKSDQMWRVEVSSSGS